MPPPVHPPATPPLDEALLRQYRDGSVNLAELFPRLVDAYQPMLLLLAKRMGFPDSDAEEIVQETFVRVYDYLRSHTVVDSFWPWLTTVFRNLAFNRVRDSQARRRTAIVVDESLLDLMASADPTAEESAIQHESVTAIREAFERALTTDEARILLLRFVEDKSLSEIARDLGVSVSTVYHRHSVALRKLRDYLVKREAGLTEKTRERA